LITRHNRYNLSKLIQIYIIRELASLIDPINKLAPDANSIVINCLDPCFCATELAGGLTGGMKAFFTVFEFLFARTAEEGSRLVVSAASAGRDTHGGYMRSGVLKTYPPMITGQEGVNRGNVLWEQLGKRLEAIQPGILGHVKSV
jgi:retinol dehydrogenase-12